MIYKRIGYFIHYDSVQRVTYMRLCHGSKSGIRGNIRPDLGRSMCDFGKGFYLGDLPDQPIGLIANDKMFQLLERFYDGTLCDRALIDGLSRVRLGNQYVLKTVRACSAEHLQIISERTLTAAEKKSALAQSENKFRQMSGFIGELQTKYRRARDVRFFDEIMEEWD